MQNLIPIDYVWLVWSLVLVLIWAVVFILLKPASRKEMLIVSLWTALFGITEPIFVPSYWLPPSLFDLARKTGFDLESFIFSFAIGGLAVILYELLVPVRHMDMRMHDKIRHKYHFLAIISTPLIFFGLYFFTRMNPIYSTAIALIVGGVATWLCRPDLKKRMLIGAVLMTFLYFLYFVTLIWMSPGYVEKVWNLSVISGVLLLGIPLEELMFAFALGFLWSSVYEHIGWHKTD